MANFNSTILTKQGLELLARVQIGETGMQFTKAVTGDGTYTEDDKIAFMTQLKSPKQEFGLNKITIINDATVKVKIVITNAPEGKKPLKHGYHVSEVGLYAKDDDNNEILYAITTSADNEWDYLPAYNDLMPSAVIMDMYTEVCNADSVTMVVHNGIYATEDEMDLANEEIRKVNVRVDDVNTRVDGVNITLSRLHDSAFSGNAAKVNGYTVNSSVPANAKFTDTHLAVIDNLTSDSTTDALSPRQGKILDGKITVLTQSMNNSIANHTHNQYALTTHTHSNYATATHNHDTAYAAKTHTHDYAPSNHTHSNYALTNHTHSNATQSQAGHMSPTDKTKLDGIATGATKNTVSNSLTDTSITNALSAAQGKILNEKFKDWEHSYGLETVYSIDFANETNMELFSCDYAHKRYSTHLSKMRLDEFSSMSVINTNTKQFLVESSNFDILTWQPSLYFFDDGIIKCLEPGFSIIPEIVDSNLKLKGTIKDETKANVLPLDVTYDCILILKNINLISSYLYCLEMEHDLSTSDFIRLEIYTNTELLASLIPNLFRNKSFIPLLGINRSFCTLYVMIHNLRVGSTQAIKSIKIKKYNIFHNS